MKKLVVFDLDGTLLNTLEDLADSANFALSANGFKTHTIEDYKHFVGKGAGVLIKNILGEKYTNEIGTTVWADFNVHYSAHSANKTKPYDGVMDSLAKIREMGLATAILSNKRHADTIAISKKFFGDMIDFTFGHRENIPPKPDIAGMLEILSLAGADPEDTIYFGDSDVDMVTGKTAGVYTVGVSWGFRSKKELETNGADAIIDHPKDIFTIVVDKFKDFIYTT